MGQKYILYIVHLSSPPEQISERIDRYIFVQINSSWGACKYYISAFWGEGVGDLTKVAYLAYVVRRQDKEKIRTTSTMTIKITTQTN